MLKFLRFVVLVVTGLAVAGVSDAAPRNLKKHALVKVVVAVAHAPKYTLVGLKDTVGSVLFVAEAGVDVVHVGTTALSAAASTELKHNPFAPVDKVVGKVDSGLEKGYLFLFHAQI